MPRLLNNANIFNDFVRRAKAQCRELEEIRLYSLIREDAYDSRTV
jgi:hypothetical protein